MLAPTACAVVSTPLRVNHPIPSAKQERRMSVGIAHKQSNEVFPRPRNHNQLNKNTLFWSIYEIEHPEEAFLGTKANAEIAHRVKVIDFLKKTPKRLKETNSKLTIEQTQALFGAMLTATEDKLEFCTAYAAYYNKPIIVVYENTYRVFSPTVEINIAEDEDPIVLYAKKQEYSKNIFYISEKNLTKDVLLQITKCRILGPLRSMSSYKNPELDQIAESLQIPITQLIEAKPATAKNVGLAEEDATHPFSRQNDPPPKCKPLKEKRRSKEDIYNDIKVAIHNDMNFIPQN
jgi:hypothetical protein